MLKKFILLALLTLVTPLWADYLPGSQTLNVQFGGGGSDNEFEWSDIRPDGRDVEATDGGGALGGQYIYYVTAQPAIGLGIDISHNFLGDHSERGIFPNLDSNSHFRPTTFLAMAKLAYPKGALRPYVFAGVGVHNTHFLLELTPNGATWSDTGTAETRKIMDGSASAAAVAYGVGADWFPAARDHFFLGLELRGNYLASADYGVTAQGRAAGFTNANGDLSYSNLFLRAGLKFGL